MRELPDDLSVLVLAPVGRDTRLIADALSSASICASAVENVQEAAELATRSTIGALLIAEEALNPANIVLLVEALSTQPPWSDLPVIILTVGGRTTALSHRREQDRLPLGSISLLERPIRMATLISSVRSAIRSRRRQYQVRDTLMERDLAEQGRAESESRLLLAIDTAHLGSWELNLRTGLLEASATCRHHYDWPADLPLHYHDLVGCIHPEDRGPVEARIHAASEMAGVFAADHRVLWRDGSTHWISISGRDLRAGGHLPGTPGQGSPGADARLSGVTLDITERVLSEQALRKAEKLSVVGRLASSIAHEINNPLEAVTNLLYLLTLSPLGPTELEYVATAQQELARVSEITAQTLSFSRQQDAFQEVVLADILNSVLALYRGRLATSNIEVQRTYRHHQPIRCHSGEIRQVFTNLIGNAFDATRQGGTIIVRERLSRHPRSQRMGIRITIADTGSGIARELQLRLFEAFVSTKGNNGTGLGLWISKGIVEKHGGTVRCKSSQRASQSGTVFSLFLPLS